MPKGTIGGNIGSIGGQFRLIGVDPIDLTQPPVAASCIAQWWADDLVPLGDGTAVDSWSDRVSGKVISSTGTNRPTFDIDGMNSRPTVNFDGTNDYLSMGSALSAGARGCVVAVFTSPGSNSNYRYLWSHAQTNSIFFFLAGGEQLASRWIARYENIGVSRYFTGDDIPSSGNNVMEWSSNGSLLSVRRNGSIVPGTYDKDSSTTMAAAGVWFSLVPDANRWTIGALYRSTIGSYWEGNLAFLGVYSSPLNSINRTNLYNWIANTYGI